MSTFVLPHSSRPWSAAWRWVCAFTCLTFCAISYGQDTKKILPPSEALVQQEQRLARHDFLWSHEIHGILSAIEAHKHSEVVQLLADFRQWKLVALSTNQETEREWIAWMLSQIELGHYEELKKLNRFIATRADYIWQWDTLLAFNDILASIQSKVDEPVVQSLRAAVTALISARFQQCEQLFANHALSVRELSKYGSSFVYRHEDP